MDKYIVEKSNIIMKKKHEEIWNDYIYIVKWDGKSDIIKYTVDKDRFYKIYRNSAHDSSMYNYEDHIEEHNVYTFVSYGENSYIRYQEVIIDLILKIRNSIESNYIVSKYTYPIQDELFDTLNDTFLNHKITLINCRDIRCYRTHLLESDKFEDYIIISSVKDISNLTRSYNIVIINHYISVIKCIFESNSYILNKFKLILSKSSSIIISDISYNSHFEEYKYFTSMFHEIHRIYSNDSNLSYSIIDDKNMLYKIAKNYSKSNEDILIVSDDEYDLDLMIDMAINCNNVKLVRFREVCRLYENGYSCSSILLFINSNSSLNIDTSIYYAVALSRSKIYMNIEFDTDLYMDIDHFKSKLEIQYKVGKSIKKSKTFISDNIYFSLDDNLNPILINSPDTKYMLYLEESINRENVSYIMNTFNSLQISSFEHNIPRYRTDIRSKFSPDIYNYKYGIYTDLILDIEKSRTKRKLISVISYYKFMSREFLEGSKFAKHNISFRRSNIDDIKSILKSYIFLYIMYTYESKSELPSICRSVLRLFKIMKFDKYSDNRSLLSSLNSDDRFIIYEDVENINKIIKDYNRMNRKLLGDDSIDIKQCSGSSRDKMPTIFVENTLLRNWIPYVRLERVRTNKRMKYVFKIDELFLYYMKRLNARFI